ncbi:MAG: chromosomal replication initiator protein DnaA, partial [Candidatus Yanofskybacteria bacterium CG10_big_fil_rev_8_21_14_0_10_46_23]
PNAFVKEWLENKFHRQIVTSLCKLEPAVREVKYHIGTASAPSDLYKKDFSRLINESEVEERVLVDVDRLTNLNKRYSFKSFVVGSHNELAHAACLAITKNLGRVYNPLFIYGGVGLGKTHLLQSLGNEILQNNATKKILYIPSDRLTADIVESIKNKNIEDLKKKYSHYDVLMIDDIQFIAGKEKTQEIIFSTFNELHAKDKQIVLSSDRAPKAIPAIEERLRSRFEGGMIADISPPELETRLAILKLKAKERGFEVPEEVFGYIATNIQKNIRELEGALNRIIAVSQIYNRVPNLKEVKKFLQTYINTPFKKTTPQAVLKAVSDFYGITQIDLAKRSRKKEVVRPRQIAMYLLREETKASFPEIGQKIGGRDHSTVIHAYEKIQKEERESEATKQELILIKERIYQSFETLTT